MPSVQAIFARQLMRLALSGWSGRSAADQRAWQEKSARWMRPAKGFVPRPVDVDGVPAEWFVPAQVGGGVILYMHGGAYALGSVDTHREFLIRLANATQAKVLAINYRLAPEHPFPAALDDSVAAYRWLLAQGISASEIVIAGDSAGGGLAISTLVALREEAAPLPAGAVCISPWVDLALTGASIQGKAKLDPILSQAFLAQYARFYAGSFPMTDPLISPLYADLRGLPSLLIQVGTHEILEDDAIRFAEKARDAGNQVAFEKWEGLFHVFPITPFLPEAQQALAHIASFVSDVIAEKP